MGSEAHRVTVACGMHYRVGQPCNQFVQNVARNLGIALPGPAANGKADDIVATLRFHWTPLTRHEAILAAGKGKFIVAGLSSTNFNWRPIMNAHQRQFALTQKQFSGPAVAGVKAPITESGHVCVVIPGALNGFPRVFSSNAERGVFGKSRGDHPLAGHVFTHADAAKVEYFTPPR